jgi:hypothetical protein
MFIANTRNPQQFPASGIANIGLYASNNIAHEFNANRAWKFARV